MPVTQAKASGVGFSNLPFDLNDFTAVSNFNTSALAPVTAIVNSVLGATPDTVAQAGMPKAASVVYVHVIDS